LNVSEQAALLKRSGFFDPDWYRQEFPDVTLSGLAPEEHYLRYGAPMGRDPSPRFDTAFYLRQEPSAAENPLLHFLRTGKQAGLAPHPSAQELHPVELIRRAAPTDTVALEWEYRARGLDREPDRFVLYRIVGNDLYPRHKRGQALENVRFILENEPALAECEKRWIVNRIFDPEQEAAIVAMLEAHGQPYLRIPFDAEAYRAVGWDTDVLPAPGYLASEEFHGMAGLGGAGLLRIKRAATMTHRLKNNYVMNNNGARNTALRDGRARAKWVLPWDGNCFVTAAAWDEIRAAVTAKPWLTHFVVPMARILDNADLIRADFVPDPVEEPQLLFRRDGRAEFDERFCYGRRPKVELFWRLGIPGKWDSWKDDPWDLPRPPLSDEARRFDAAGWVARLFSGASELETADHQSFKQRGRVREDAITATIDLLDQRLAAEADGVAEPEAASGPVFYRPAALAALRAELAADTPPAGLAAALLADAESALGEGPFSVTHKTSLPPSGDPHDYWHPAPYWWPNPKTADGLPYVKRDGERVPGTEFGSPESDKYDRTRLQQMFDTTLALGLAWHVTGRDDFAAAASRNLQAWFVDPETRMTPHLEQAQVRLGHNGNKGNNSGVIEFKDIAYLLDAVRLLEAGAALPAEVGAGLRAWLESYLDWLQNSPQGRKERMTANNHGTYYDLQFGAIAAFLGRRELLRETLIRAQSRLAQQILPNGLQPEEMRRTTTAHYAFFNLQGWVNLVRLGQSTASLHPVWTAHPWSLLRQAVVGLLAHDLDLWPYPQLDAFDTLRATPLAAWARQEDLLDRAQAAALRGGDPATLPARFHPHDGIPCYWELTLPAPPA
jgi:hypothetical protein